MKAFISGAISNLDYREAWNNFERCENALKAIGITQIFNPMREIDPLLPYEKQMEICLAAIETSDVLIQQRNWNESAGAKREFEKAHRCGLQILHDRGADYESLGWKIKHNKTQAHVNA
jgi:hypothetical protein